jgi:integrase
MSHPIPLTDPLSLAYLDWSRTKAPINTTKSRLSSLRTLPNAGTATREQVEAWWDSRSHLSPATRHNDLAHLRMFYRWCQRWEHRADDPTTRLDSPKVELGLPRPMSRADLNHLLDVLAPDLRRAVCLGAYAGLRVSEVARLDWSNVDLENMQIRVMKSKGNKSRRVPISPALLEALLPNTGGNVVSGCDVPYSTARLMHQVHLAFKSLGIDCTFHQLRHRYATLAYAASKDLLVVSRLLGHASVVTTQVYVATDDGTAAAIALAVSA